MTQSKEFHAIHEAVMKNVTGDSHYCLLRHGRWVGGLARSIAGLLDPGDWYFQNECEKAGLFHDIGKIFIPREVLLKNGRLNNQEWKFIHGHPEHGSRYLARFGFSDAVVDAAHFHHVRYSGGGYPRVVVRCEEIPLTGRIVAVADYVCARVEDRPYRAGENLETIWRDMSARKGTAFDPRIVEAAGDAIRIKDWLQELKMTA